MHGDFEDKVAGGLDSEEFTAYGKMPAAAHGQEFGKTLHKTEYQCFQPAHSPSLLIIATSITTIPAMITIGAATRRRKSNML